MSLDLNTVRKATNYFSGENKIEDGGFGVVYKGRLPDGQEIAVKRFSRGSNKGEREFENEVLLLAKLQHPNLVRLIGSCFGGNERFLIYEFVPNATLHFFISDPIKRSELDWERRYKILLGIVRGLLYLHKSQIIHHDLQPCNILLDQDMNPRITNFGMSRLGLMDFTAVTRAPGSCLHFAPEYMVSGGYYSQKSDVFSFGVLLLEIVCRRNSGIMSRAWEHWREDTWLDLIDPILRSNGSSSTADMKKCIHIGFLCVQDNAADRPVMESVVRMLRGDSTALPMPSKPRYHSYMCEPATTEYESESDKIETFFEPEFSQYDFETVQEATNNFNVANELGKGGFGLVYKGRFENGQEVAIKRLLSNSGQGDREFKTEVEILAKLQHRNLVRLLGYCMDGDERLLIYEFLPNSSLDKFIFDPTKRSELKWENLYGIILGIAQGLLYLHEDSHLQIAHLDIKSGNILLDNDMQPKIADFGLARLFPDDQTHLTVSKNGGTIGYMAPEYVFSRQCSVRADVFSFGVLLLEIVIGQRNASIQDEESMGGIINHTWKHWWAKTTLNLIDQTLRPNDSDTNQILKCIHIGLLCVQDVAARPTMAKVVDMLRGKSSNLPIPEVAAFWKSSQRTVTPSMVNHSIWKKMGFRGKKALG